MKVKNNNLKKDSNVKFNKKVVIVISIVALIFILSLALLLFRRDSNTLTLNSYFDESEKRIVKNCKLENTDDCLPVRDDVYLKLVLAKSYPGLDEKIDDINAATDNLYELAMNSDMSSDDCIEVKDKYLHQRRYDSIYDTYENDKYVSVAVQRYNYDVCTNGYGVDPIEVYIYDIGKKKIISQNEFIKNLKITDNEVKKAIDNDMSSLGEEYVQDKYENITYYYGYYGELYATYMSEGLGTFYTSIIRDSDTSFTSNLKSPNEK